MFWMRFPRSEYHVLFRCLVWAVGVSSHAAVCLANGEDILPVNVMSRVVEPSISGDCLLLAAELSASTILRAFLTSEEDCAP